MAKDQEEKRARFRELWESKSPEEREEFAFGLQQSDAGAGKKVQELTAERDRYKELAESGDLSEERARLAAAKRFLDVQNRLLEKAVRHEIDPAVAIEFARSKDPDALFDGVVGEIRKGVDAGVNQRLSAFNTAPEGSPSQNPVPDLAKLSQKEIARLPKGVFQEYLTRHLMGG